MAVNVILGEIEPGKRLDGESWGQVGEVYTAHGSDNEVLKRSASDDMLETDDYQAGPVSNPDHACCDGTYVYVTLWASDEVITLLRSDMSLHATLTTFDGADTFSGLSGICCDNAGNIYVVDGGNERIIKFTSAAGVLTYDSKIGSVGSGNDQFNNPVGIDTDNTFLFIADMSNNRIQKRNCSNLAYVAKIGSAGSGNDQFSNPIDIANDGTNLFITDYSNNRIHKRLILDLSYVAKIGSLGSGNDNFNGPAGIGHVNGSLYIADYGNDRLVKRAAIDLSYVSETTDGIASVIWGADGYTDVVYYLSHTETPSRVTENGAELTDRKSVV